ncbi:hypothetical protein [Nocardia terpenica]|uniref:Uncharacterized protein n=1 Tax=Nocardia terpenica TaxID=455432 RepID=A0A164LA85_9NOCA|nr:hypothetical protein [Nocardia terpenica]KZM72181.1 hypothetical protein AWN90_36505 [Nocardia terpenica]NQE86677.1 hypothetical protein [Nocardia terpenica]
MGDEATALWDRSIRHAEGLVQWLIPENPGWWKRAHERSIDAETVSELLAYGIWQATQTLAAVRSITRPGESVTVDEVGFTRVSDELSLDPLTDELRSIALTPERWEVLPHPTALTKILALVTDPERDQEWKALVRVTQGVLVGHVVRSGIGPEEALSLGDRRNVWEQGAAPDGG